MAVVGFLRKSMGQEIDCQMIEQLQNEMMSYFRTQAFQK